MAAALCTILAVSIPAHALKPIEVTPDLDRLEITSLSELHEGRGDTLQIETAPAPDGSTERIVVRASTPGLNPNWLIFALHNPTEKAIELWVTADRYNVAGSGVMWPDLDARRIEAVSHSAGFSPERIKNDRVDIFRITIERGQTITYAAELVSDRFARVYLWKPIEFEQRQRERFLFNGVMLGVMGLMAVFLTAVFAANHKMIFPSAALVAWCVLGLLCVDFGFWHKLFQMRPEDNAQYRAAAEAATAASLVIFLFAFLRVSLWHGFIRILFVAWIVGQLGIVATAVLDPRLAATGARLSIAVIGVLGMLIIGFLAARRLERALALVPTWMLFLVWLFGAAVTLTGRLPGEVAFFGLVSGLVLIMVLIGFTVTQFAFRSNEPIYGVSPNQRQLRLAAIEHSAVTVWEWSARRNEIKLDPEIEASLGLGAGELPTKVDDFLALVHPADRDRIELTLQGIQQEHGGSLRLEVRLRHVDSSYRCFEFDGATVPTRDPKSLRCVGLVRDVTDAKRAQERLLHDAVYDSLTGLPNRELLIDRVNAAVIRARTEAAGYPTVFFVDLDNFRSVNASFGLIVGDSILLTVSRRLSRHLGPLDTLARIGGDQFAFLVVGRYGVQDLARMAEQLRMALRAPIRIAGQEIVLTGAIGVAMFDTTQQDGRDLLREAEVAMHKAKRGGSDKLEIFRPEMRAAKDDRAAIAGELREAIGTKQIRVLYQPIVSLATEELVGLEALVRWEHPRLGVLWPADFVPVAEDSGLVLQLGSFVISRAVGDVARWQKELARPEMPLFASVNISSRQLVKPDLAQEVRHITAAAVVPASILRLEISEPLVMENPEQATRVLDMLREIGVGLTLDEFGTGYTSIAYLNRFPFDAVKLDKDLVHSSSQDEAASVITRSTVALAHELGKTIVADGIESPEDAAFLRSLGCQSGQGFYYGEPMGDADITRLIRLIGKTDRKMRRRGMVRAQEKRKTEAAAGTAGAAAGTGGPVPQTARGEPYRSGPVVSSPPAYANATSGQPAAARIVLPPAGIPPSQPLPVSKPLLQPPHFQQAPGSQAPAGIMAASAPAVPHPGQLPPAARPIAGAGGPLPAAGMTPAKPGGEARPPAPAALPPSLQQLQAALNSQPQTAGKQTPASTKPEAPPASPSPADGAVAALSATVAARLAKIAGR